ncbi:MAG: helix-turn-helix transcriptional regulator [Candidatus Omnitrophica bacterium]|nr:helix-turn-helix transcriptional regulator [Candidatus Omnitrophota bacterium]
MLIGEKLKKIREDQKISIPEVCKIMQSSLQKEEVISDQTIRNIENSVVQPRLQTLKKLSSIYGVDILELTQGTEFISHYDTIRNKERDNFFFHENFIEYIISPSRVPFKISEFHLNPRAATPIEASPVQIEKNTNGVEQKISYIKFVTVISGRLKIHINDKVINLYRGDTHSFDATQKHSFENILNKKSIFHVYLNPKHY